MASAAPPAVSAAAVRTLTCPNCGGTVTVRAAGYTVTMACIYCGSILDVANPDVRLITAYNQAAAELQIPLGTRATLRGAEWETIGYLRRSEGGAYPWEEYLLFNPYLGYRWLITNGRGWSFGEMLTRSPDWGPGGLTLDNQAYAPFFRNGTAQVDYVLGEFYWRVAVGEEVATDDYVRPGWMLSREANSEEVSWTVAALLDPAEMQAAYNISPPVNPWPPLPHQPSPYLATLRIGWKIAAAACAALILCAILFSGGSSLLSQTLTNSASQSGKDNSQTLGPIHLGRPYQMVWVRASAPQVENGWIDLDYSLVNRATQESYDAYGVAEHYYGSDSDGPWSEGNRGGTVQLAGIPAGDYDLVVTYSGHEWQSPSTLDTNVQIDVGTGSVFASNLLVILVLILAPLGFFFFRHMKFERDRMNESDVGVTGAAALFQQSED